MYPIPARWLRLLAGPRYRAVRAEWSNDLTDWTACQLVAASVTADRTADIRYRATAIVTGVPLGPQGVNAVTTYLRLFSGIRATRTGTYWVPCGTYVVTGTDASRTSVALDLEGLEKAVQQARFPTPRTVGPDNAGVIIRRLVTEAIPAASVVFDGISEGTTVPRITAEDGRWQLLSGADTSTESKSIAEALAADLYANAAGVFVVAPVPAITDTPVWTITKGRTGTSVETSGKQTSTDLVNVVVAKGDAQQGKPTVVGYAWDDDPESLTYAGPDPIRDPSAPARLGLDWVRTRTDIYSSSLITTTTQATRAARARLNNALGVASSVTVKGAVNPALEPGDVIVVELDDGTRETHLVDSLTFDLLGADMDITTRTSLRRYDLGDDESQVGQ